MNNDLRNELLDRDLNDMLHLSEVISGTSRHLGMHPHDAAVMGPTLEAIDGFTVLGCLFVRLAYESSPRLLELACASWCAQ